MCIPPSPEYKNRIRAPLRRRLFIARNGHRAGTNGDVWRPSDDYYSSFYQNMYAAILQGQTTRADFLKIGIENNLFFDDLCDVRTFCQKL